MSKIKREPSAAMRQAAMVLAELYAALKNEGFTTVEALRVCAFVITAQTDEQDER